MDEPNKPTIRERFADAVDISKDVILDTALIRMIGNRDAGELQRHSGVHRDLYPCQGQAPYH